MAEHTREQNIYFAQLAEQCELYDDMTGYMKLVALESQELNVEERNLLSVAYKNAVGSRRATRRILGSIETKQKSKENDFQVALVKEYRAKIDAELSKICNDILALIDQSLVATASDPESKVFYGKMKGDYYRYLAEIDTGDARQSDVQKASEAYNLAMELATANLSPTSPIRLGLALNYSVFDYEIVKDRDAACKMAQDAFDEGVAQLDNESDENQRDSTLIMQLLRDNLTLWTDHSRDTVLKPGEEED